MNIPLIPTAHYLHELHSVANLSDAVIGKKVGLSRTTIWRLRTGKHTTTTTEYGIKIANLHAQAVVKNSRSRAA